MSLTIDLNNEIKLVNFQPRLITIRLHTVELWNDYDEFIKIVNEYCSRMSAINVQISQRDTEFNRCIIYKAIISEQYISELSE